MFPTEYQNLILHLINERGSIKISELEEKFKISKMTIWRDLKMLDVKGLVKKVQGGALKREIVFIKQIAFIKQKFRLE